MRFSHILTKINLTFLVSDRQLNQCASQARYLPTTEAGNVLPSDHCDRQWAPADEQHQHSDHSGVWVQQRWYRPVLQRWGLCSTHRPQHGSPHRYPGLHCSALRCVYKTFERCECLKELAGRITWVFWSLQLQRMSCTSVKKIYIIIKKRSPGECRQMQRPLRESLSSPHMQTSKIP